MGSNLAEGDGVIRAIKTCSTAYFRGDVKPEVPCCKILQHDKELFEV
jgi:hypothetical protein